MEELNNNQLQENEEVQKEELPKFRGLYRYVNITVKQLDMIIAACILVIVIVTAMSLLDPGIAVNFNSMGGSDVPNQEQEYGELLEEPVPPTREGYVFTGWYKDYSCYELWDMENDTIQEDITLFAGWEKTE
jgi:uncharacterized repeat protein (TIGR02543 family)